MSSSKYQLLICPCNEYVKQKLINSAESDRLLYNEGNVTTILSGNDSGIDMFYCDDETLTPGETKIISLSVKCKMIQIDNGMSVAYYMYPRSSISKTPLRLANSVGIIDKDYRGEIKSPLTNNPNIAEYMRDLQLGIDVKEKYSYTIKKGTRLVQICSPDLSPLSIRFVDNLDSTHRGTGGFGSTGI